MGLDNGRNASSVWRTIALAQIGVIVTGVGSWLLLGREAVTRTELPPMVAQASPWMIDKPNVFAQLDLERKERREADVQLSTRLDSINETLSLIRSENATQNAKLDQQKELLMMVQTVVINMRDKLIAKP